MPSWAGRKQNVTGFLALAIIMGLAFYLGMIPRLDYAYPLHADEWTHWAEARAIVESKDIPPLDAVTGEPRLSPHIEVGYHLFLAELRLVTGLPWLTIFRFLPSSVFALTVLGAYIFGNRHGFGLEAALFTCLITTTVRFLGPAFAVPVALALLFVPLGLFLVSSQWSSSGLPVLLAVLLSFAFLTHAATAGFVSLIVIVYGLVNTVSAGWSAGVARRKALAHLAAVLAAVALSSLPFLVNYSSVLVQGATGPPLPDPLLKVPGGIMAKIGYIPYGLFGLGLWILAVSREGRDRALLLVIVLLVLSMFVYQWFGIGYAVFYSRSVVYLWMMVLLIAGLTTSHLRRWLTTTLGRTSIGHGSDIAAGLLVVALLLPSIGLSLLNRHQDWYYRLIDGTDYEDYAWIRENLDVSYEKALVDTNLARPFAAITGRYVHAPIPLSSLYWTAPGWPLTVEARRVLREGVPDTAWLRERGVSIVYSDELVTNPELVQVGDRVYVLPLAEASGPERPRLD